MKIAVLFPKDSIGFFDKDSKITFGGATVQLHNICFELKNQNIDITALIPDYNKINDKSKITYNSLEIYKTNSSLFKKFISMLVNLRKVKPDFVFQRGISPLSLPFVKLLKTLKIKSVFMFAHDIETKGFYQNNRKPYKQFEKLIHNSSILICQNQLQKINLDPKYYSKVIIFKKGIGISNNNNSDFLNRQYDSIWIARCEKWKNPEIYINLAKNNPKNKFAMVCSKSPTNDKYFDQIKILASTCSNLEFHEYFSNEEIHKLYQNSRLFCLTSDSEGDWPMTVLEAASYSLPILSLSINIEDSINRYDFGFFCKNSEKELNNNFTLLLKNNGILCKKGKNSVKFIQDVHSLKNNIKRLIKELSN